MPNAKNQTKPSSFLAIPIILTLVAFVAGVWLVYLFRQDPTPSIASVSQHAKMLNPPKALQPFKLVNHHGEAFTLESLRDKWSFVFFGYTHCPDICPTTLQVLAEMDRQLAKQPQHHRDIQIVFVSVDPKRDTAKQLASYVPYFNKGFIGVTGDLAAIDGLTKQLGIMHMRRANQDGKGYLVDHSAAILLFDPSASWRGLFSAPHKPKQLLDGFLKIKQQS